MERHRFDQITKSIGAMTRRRAVARVLGVAAATPLLSLLGAPLGDNTVEAAQQEANTLPRYKKPRTFCLNGKTVRSKRKGRILRWKRKGATRGQCPTVVCDVSCPSNDPTICGAELNAALAAGGTIRVCPGEYAGPFPLTVDVELIGAGAGDNPSRDTILSGVDGQDSVVPVTSAVTVRLASLRITGGNGGGPNSGGVYVNNGDADVTIDDCALVGNAGNFGGGASVYNGELTITGSEISGNTAGGSGGGIATATVSTIQSTRIFDNTAATSGGGIFVNSGTSNLGSGVTITDNTSNGGAGTGGGIFKFNSGSTINNSATVTNNTPDNCAGPGFTCP